MNQERLDAIRKRNQDGLPIDQNDVDWMLEEIARLKIARDALRYYADPSHFTEVAAGTNTICVLADGGQCARDGLAGIVRVRPKNFASLSPEEQWAVDKRLGLLDEEP